MIQFENVGKRYATSQREALKSIELTIEKGEIAFLTGRSGAGKSTLLKLVALIERPTQGTLTVNGRNVAAVKPGQIPAYRRQIGMVFQDHKLLSDRTVFNNVALPLVIAGVGEREAGRRVRAALDQVGLLKLEQSMPDELSIGEQQRVGIARAIVTKPPILIADEPTGNLDPDLSYEIMRLFRRFNEVGVTVLIASHDVVLIDSFAVRRIRLDQGQIAEDIPAPGPRPGGAFLPPRSVEA